MVKKALCTISTLSYAARSATMLLSARQYDRDMALFVLIVDDEGSKAGLHTAFPAITFLTLSDFKDGSAENLKDKYAGNMDALRWSLKPVLLKKLITGLHFHQVLYCDNDIFFFSQFDFLLEDLKHHDILLFPHWRINTPQVDKDWFETNFKDGIFNGGCIGVNNHAVAFLDWWAACCQYRCEISFADGLYVDQKYLDLVPALFEKSKIIRHKGCNLAYWNIKSLHRTLKDKRVLIDGKYEVVFVHFTGDYLNTLAHGGDFLMRPYYEKYLQHLEAVDKLMKQALSPA